MDTIGFSRFSKQTNLIFVFDHVGRSGNGFVLGIFDQHPEVMTSHWVHYVYSYIVTEFGEASELDSKAAYEFMLNRSYFQFVFKELNEEIRGHIYKVGGDPDTPYDRELCRRVFKDIVLAEETISRRDLVLASYYATLVGMGRDASQMKYVMVADSVSLRTENVIDGFSGKVMQAALHDFPDLKAISLVRDPRAMFASNRHQFVNVLGNMYGVTFRNVLQKMKQLFRRDFQMYSTVWPFWFTYGAATTRCIYKLRRENPAHFRVLKNEDLNLHFHETIKLVCDWLGIGPAPEWSDDPYEPTSMGRPWMGTGAYNSRYQSKTNGALENDSKSVAEKSAGPNAHVTKRWRKKMAPHESRLIEILFREELEDLGYEKVDSPVAEDSFLRCLYKPFNGELPTLSWLRRGFEEGGSEGRNRLFYSLVFPAFYVASRAVIFKMYREGFFENISSHEHILKASKFLSPTHRVD